MKAYVFNVLRTFRIFILIVMLFILTSGVILTAVLLPWKRIAQAQVTVDNYNISRYTKDSLIIQLKKDYNWNLELEGQGISIDIEDSITPVIEDTVSEAFASYGKATYQINLSDDMIEEIAKNAVTLVNDAAEAMATDNTSLMEYSKTQDKFLFMDMVVAPVLDEEALKTLLTEALQNKEFDQTIEIPFSSDGQVTSASDFKQIGYYQTKTTANSNRNTNINLACETINGTILLPGETFDYNEVLGPRTAAKGYKEAGVYLNGLHTTGIGGGICQVSSTIYNAVFAANLQVDQRTGHTFEPSYVTPGLDATVSYPEPDFVFTNNSDNPIGLLVHYEDRLVTVEIYGVPTLDDGVTRYMTAKRVSSLNPPATIYQDNPSLGFGQELVVSAGKCGSKWATYEVLEKNGTVISETFLYYTSYKGEAGVVQRNFIYY